MPVIEEYFHQFRENIIGINQTFISPYGEHKIIYADWVASGRLYSEIEKTMVELFGPYVGNTHSEASITGTTMTHAYHHAHEIIKSHVNASNEDVIITAGSGMTGVINKLQRILGLRVPEQLKDFTNLPSELKPVVFLTHMEHHSNQTSWIETIADVIILEPDQLGLVNPQTLQNELNKYSDRKLIIGAFTSCSNVTGIRTPYHKLAKIMHQNGGYCFIDFACSAPYDNINMHPTDTEEKLDAIFFSPHKFLGGPATPGVLIFDSNLYHNQVPDNPGGGTVDWTNPWGQHKFVNSIEAREDGGTPPFLQTIKAALAIKLKNKMSSDKMIKREEELIEIVFYELEKIPSLHILAGHIKERLGAISFYVDGIHYNLVVKLLNDRFGIQVRGGCSCAGTYGHFLLHVDQNYSNKITDKINHGDFSEKPGWVRLSLHPTMTNDEVHFICSAIKQIVENIAEWKHDYNYDIHTNEFFHKDSDNMNLQNIDKWFSL
ncbi:MAG: aminotransferase class V-fold PLP-dependent enzyme [Ignavibacteria bacterium]|nr:aminotransferase class V-fold PLP-dependent enzyme [Ignavibacteria bacterium]